MIYVERERERERERDDHHGVALLDLHAESLPVQDLIK